MAHIIVLTIRDGILCFDHMTHICMNTDIDLMIKNFCKLLRLNPVRYTEGESARFKVKRIGYRVETFSMVGELKIFMTEHNLRLEATNGSSLSDEQRYSLVKPLCNKAGYFISRQEVTTCLHCETGYPHDHKYDLNIPLITNFELMKR